MKLVYGCVIALSMYSRIPMPRVEWTKERMEHVLCFFPLVGIAGGLILGGWLLVSRWLGLSELMTALWGTAVPILVTGGIHMDGFLDTMDAIHSYGNREKRLEIMKDPHTGAFAIISAMAYICLYAGAMGEYVRLTRQEGGGFFFLLPVFYLAMERAFSGLGVLALPKAKKEGLAASFSEASKGRTDRKILILWIVLMEIGVLAAAWCFAGETGLSWNAAEMPGGWEQISAAWGRGILRALLPGLPGAVQLGVFLWFGRMAKRAFGGITGDLAGWFLQVCELASLAAFVVLARV